MAIKIVMYIHLIGVYTFDHAYHVLLELFVTLGHLVHTMHDLLCNVSCVYVMFILTGI